MSEYILEMRNITKEFPGVKALNNVSFKVKKDDANGSFDSLTGSTISSRAYVNAVETAYAGYLWAKGELPSANDAASGATQPAEQQTQNNETEPEAQKGEVSNE